MSFNCEALKKIADDNFKGVMGLHRALVRAGIDIDPETVKKWCHGPQANPTINLLHPVYMFLRKNISKKSFKQLDYLVD